MNKVIEEQPLTRFGIIEFGWNQFPMREMDLQTRKAIYDQIIPIRSLYDNEQFMQPKDRMICYSELFREMKEGERYPIYDITLQRSEDGTSKVIKVEERKRY